jgi:hypothetical protein
MFEIAVTRSSGPATGPGQVRVCDHHAYLRLFFGRFLADVTVTEEGDVCRYQWLIPDGLGGRPAPQRIRSELSAFERAMAAACREVAADPALPGGSTALTRRTMAAQILAEFRVPWSGEDIRFTRRGGLVVINWCAFRPQSGPRLAECRPRLVMERLARTCGVGPWGRPGADEVADNISSNG